MADEPGGIMYYSTGNFHLVSALLTRITKRDTHSLAQDWLAKLLGFTLPPWQKSP
jgi:CubicO group peptidase (beta-lactamase class C family)